MHHDDAMRQVNEQVFGAASTEVILQAAICWFKSSGIGQRNLLWRTTTWSMV
jgi:hypothetical protein